MSRIAFIGAGRWALALALKLHDRGHAVALWEPSAESLARFAAGRLHPDLPLDGPVPERVAVTGDAPTALAAADFAVFAVPSTALAQTASAVADLLATSTLVVTVTKGIDPQSLKRLSVVLGERVRRTNICVLAGPGIPYDVVAGDPTSLVAASDDPTTAERVRDTFAGGTLRVYSHPDVVGVELGAAIKNVVAIAGGICDGIGLGINAKAALLTRGLAETVRLGVALNASPMTFAGLSGMGDLIVTAFSPNSRNHELGRLIGSGLPLTEARTRLNGVAEGAITCRSVRAIAARQNVTMPICDEVYRILHEGVSPDESLKRLIDRKPKPEVWR